jgi:hypothetical protein
VSCKNSARGARVRDSIGTATPGTALPSRLVESARELSHSSQLHRIISKCRAAAQLSTRCRAAAQDACTLVVKVPRIMGLIGLSVGCKRSEIKSKIQAFASTGLPDAVYAEYVGIYAVICRHVNIHIKSSKAARRFRHTSMAGWNVEMKAQGHTDASFGKSGWWMDNHQQDTGAFVDGINTNLEAVFLVSCLPPPLRW